MPRISGPKYRRRGIIRFARRSQTGCWAVLVLWLSTCCSTPVAHAQSPSTPLRAPQPERLHSTPVPLAVALETRGDLTLQSATIEKALITIGASWGVNIVVGKDVQGNVSCLYKQAPLREVLDAILLANGYSYRAVGESLVVQRAQDVGSANPLFESAAIAITHSDMKEILEGAQLLLSKDGKIQALESAKSILVVDYVDRVASVRAFVAQMDAAASKETGGIPAESYQRLQVSYFHTQYVPVDSVKAALTAVLSPVGRVATMPAENRLVVVDYASNIAMIRRVLDKLDQPRPQVRITALIYDISLQDIEQLGLNWNSSGKGSNLDANGDSQQSLTFDTTTLIPFATGTAGGTATLHSLSKHFDINTVALLLQNANDARLLASPNVTVMDNEIANMDSVREIPYQQFTASPQGAAAGVATTAFKEVGIKLNVTPTVAADGTIQLLINQEFSRVAGFSGSGDVPIIDTRRAETSVRVANRKTLVIGGLRQRSDTGDFNGIPYLKDVKFIGPLFRSRHTTVRESELLVFLMPEIVGYQQDPSQRESLALETINCRLDQVPMAEGCETPGANGNCSDCATLREPHEGDIIYEGQVTPTWPTNESGFVPSVGRNTPDPSTAPKNASQYQKVPLRSGFSDRYRAAGVVAPRRQAIEQTAPYQQAAPQITLTRPAEVPATTRPLQSRPAQMVATRPVQVVPVRTRPAQITTSPGSSVSADSQALMRMLR